MPPPHGCGQQLVPKLRVCVVKAGRAVACTSVCALWRQLVPMLLKPCRSPYCSSGAGQAGCGTRRSGWAHSLFFFPDHALLCWAQHTKLWESKSDCHTGQECHVDHIHAQSAPPFMRSIAYMQLYNVQPHLGAIRDWRRGRGSRLARCFCFGLGYGGGRRGRRAWDQRVCVCLGVRRAPEQSACLHASAGCSRCKCSMGAELKRTSGCTCV